MILGLLAMGGTQAHPSASCGTLNVSSHGMVAVPGGSGGALAKAAGYDAGSQGLLAVRGTHQVPVLSDSGYWEMESVFSNQSLVVSNQALAGTGMVCANQGNAVVTYAIGNQVKSKRTTSGDSAVLQTEVDVGALLGNYSDLFAAVGGDNATFYFASVDSAGGVLVQRTTNAGASWTSFPVHIHDAVSGPISGSVSQPNNVVLIAYHTSSTGIRVYSSGTQTSTALALAGASVSLASSQNTPGVVVAVANNLGSIYAVVSSNAGSVWTSTPVLVEQAVSPTGDVRLISTRVHWLATYLNPTRDLVMFRIAEDDLGATWTTGGTLFSGDATQNNTFGSNSLASTGSGDGWVTALVADADGAIRARACFDTPVEASNTPTTKAPTTKASLALPTASSTLLLIVAAVLMA
ncbi:hypothetical protein BASA81_006133 [Batrachochytrium salamandrivorans]|nr:hypothetical protein BASA81_006133 [Batrachochytrium salamandrivorans]